MIHSGAGILKIHQVYKQFPLVSGKDLKNFRGTGGSYIHLV
jgi:hypothetical protein